MYISIWWLALAVLAVGFTMRNEQRLAKKVNVQDDELIKLRFELEQALDGERKQLEAKELAIRELEELVPEINRLESNVEDNADLLYASASNLRTQIDHAIDRVEFYV